MYFLELLKFGADLFYEHIKFTALNIFTMALLISFILLGIIGLCVSMSNKHKNLKEVQITTAKNITDQHFLGYFAIFILFALTFNLTRPSMLIIFLVITIFIAIVYLNNKLLYVNPLLNILGFNFYQITYIERGSTETKTARIFYRGELTPSTNFLPANLKTENFGFIKNT